VLSYRNQKSDVWLSKFSAVLVTQEKGHSFKFVLLVYVVTLVQEEEGLVCKSDSLGML